MSNETLTLTLGVGKTHTFQASVAPDGPPLDLTDAAVEWTATDGTNTITKTLAGGGITVPAPETGAGTITIDAGDTSGWSLTASIVLAWRLIVTLSGHAPSDLDSGTLLVRVPAVTPPAPATCTILGTAPPNALIRVRFGASGQWEPTRFSGVFVDSRAFTIFADGDGAFSFSLPQGAVFVVQIDTSDTAHVGTAPLTAMADLGTMNLAIWSGR
jgi:hypothetical protein